MHWKSVSAILLSFYLGSAAYRAWINPSGAHGQRQLDTAGMSLALALDFQSEGGHAFYRSAFFPRILNRGLSSGVNAVEFPVLNLLTAPFFFLGPHWGNFLSSLGILILNLIVGLIFVPRWLALWGASLPRIVGTLIYFSIPSIESQAVVVMPEGLSFPLLVIGATWFCEDLSHGFLQCFKGIALLGLAIAVKPTASIGLLAVVGYLVVTKRKRTEVFLACFGLVLALLFPGWWYGIHVQEILKQVDGLQIFARAKFEPFSKLQEVGFWGAIQLGVRQINLWQFPIYTGMVWVAWAMIREKFLLTLLCASLLAAISLDGAHIWHHAYYFFGAGLVSLSLMAKWCSAGKGKWGELYFTLICWGVLYGVRTNIWVASRTPDWWSLAQAMRVETPPEAHWISDDTVDPTKLFFMGKRGEGVGEQVVEICRSPEYRDRSIIFIVDDWIPRSKTGSQDCLAQSQVLKEYATPFSKWRLSLWEPKKSADRQ